jgi:PPK2 family polyphosphate:nucleotide phosphotransferase
LAKDSLRELLRADRGDHPRVSLAEHDPDAMPGIKSGKAKKIDRKLEKKLAEQLERLFELQERLWAERTRAVLVCLQGMDTSGKDGTVKHVMTGLNPSSVIVRSFKAPTPEELRHNFLWRFKRNLPAPGNIAIFNRTYYEDVLIARVKHLVSDETIENRYGEINRFEEQLTRDGIRVVKFFLHISYEEQRRRLLERLEDPDKRWKFSENDINERAFWDDYVSAYDAALTRCNPKGAPWYIVPANDKRYRDWAVAQVLIETLEEMNPQYPQPKLDVAALEARLRAS